MYSTRFSSLVLALGLVACGDDIASRDDISGPDVPGDAGIDTTSSPDDAPPDDAPPGDAPPDDAPPDDAPPTGCASDCNDNDACTIDTCDAQQCVNTPKAVDDSIACTVDTCDPTTGDIVHQTTDALCGSNATCSSSLGCVCDSGFEGDGLTCSRPITFFVVRVGDGATALSTSSAAVFLEERDTTGAIVRTIALPTAAAGNNSPFTLTGTASAEGGLSLSGDGRYVTLGGYSVAPGVASINLTTNLSTDASPTKRVVARVAADGTIDTSTRLVDAFNTSSIRGVASSDGSAFWASGNSGSGATGGVHYVALGSEGPTVRVYGGQNNLRHAQVFDGQLYVSSAAGTLRGVLAIGTGLPTTTGQTAVQAAPFASTLSANSFAVLDLSPVVVGPDTIYLAFDQAGVAGTANIQKWTYDGIAWSQATFAPTLTSSAAPNAIGLATWLDGAAVHIVMTTSESPSRLVKIVDDGSTSTPEASVLATAATNTAFRGVARSPLP